MNTAIRKNRVVEVKVRLTEEDASVLIAIARREGMPSATLAHQLIKRQLRRLSANTVSPVTLPW